MRDEDKGREGEEIAAGFLKRNGYKILERNYRCRLGEIDIIAERGGEIHFVEVKYRTHPIHGTPLESITPQKISRLIKLAAHFLCERRLERACHFSVVGITKDGGRISIDFVQDAFDSTSVNN
jgi:putative endonuclease